MTETRRLRAAIERLAVARGEAQWTNGYRAGRVSCGAKSEAEDAWFAKEMQQHQECDAAEQALSALLSEPRDQVSDSKASATRKDAGYSAPELNSLQRPSNPKVSTLSEPQAAPEDLPYLRELKFSVGKMLAGTEPRQFHSVEDVMRYVEGAIELAEQMRLVASPVVPAPPEGQTPFVTQVHPYRANPYRDNCCAVCGDIRAQHPAAPPEADKERA